MLILICVNNQSLINRTSKMNFTFSLLGSRLPAPSEGIL